ncbi:MAG: hypothetical protein U0793_25740 [Gemmataceae bacterium]
MEGFRGFARVLVGALFTYWGIIILLGAVFALFGGVGALLHGDVDTLMRSLLAMIILAALVVTAIWIHKDATSELKNIQVQKQELKNREATSAPPPEAPTREPWLYP